MDGMTTQLRPHHEVRNARGQFVCAVTDQLDGTFRVRLDVRTTFDADELVRLARGLGQIVREWEASVAAGERFTDGEAA